MLNSGAKIGVYEVVALIGAGGMGEVYRARDTRLNRDVALKVLPEAFARDSERMARFEREAKVLASLNHPNIAAIYGLEESGAIRALVMELVEGPTLADRVAAGSVPLEESLPIARQVADAVEYAHEQNVIHRDLKPANIKVTAEGTVKVLDFGLAKALANESAEMDMSNSPTLSMAATMQGVILGTAAYMAPEQARGKKVDRRADVWAFGCVLYELLSGRKVFAGEDVSETLAFVMTKEAALDALPAKTPPAIRNLLRRCLERNLKRRLQNMGEARIVIEDVLSGAVPVETVAAQGHKGFFGSARIAWISTAVAVVVAALSWGAFAYFRPASRAVEAIRFFVSPPDGWDLPRGIRPREIAASPVAVSPDGRRVAFIALGPDGTTQLWVRSLETLTAQLLAGTEGAHSPFWSPDSRSLGFSTDGKLKKIDVAGGPPITLCDMESNGGTWSRDGVILFNPSVNSPIQKVAAAGGAPSAATVLGEDETDHMQPFFLPDGRHFVYTALTGTSGKPVYVASLDSAERELLFHADSNEVVYSQGHLLFLRETTLMAQPFDTGRIELTGEAFPIAEEIQTLGGADPYGFFSASGNGVLAYQAGIAVGGLQLTWFDRAGKQIGVLGDPIAQGDGPQLSPDGMRAWIAILDPTQGTQDLWIYDVARGLRTRFTFDPADENGAAWSPDGSQIIFRSNRKGHYDLYQKASSGAGSEEVLLEDDLDQRPLGWSVDGRFLLYANSGGPTGQDLFVLPLFGDRKPKPFLQTQFTETVGMLSPDGRWVAYRSNESGRNEVYVVPFPDAGGKWQVSTGGGDWPRWRADGSEIFYWAPDNELMAAAVNGKGESFQVETVRPLFEVRKGGAGHFYDVSPDGQRFLVNSIPEQAASAPITVVVNWTAGLQK
jgi:eukaryotic-like serine/threonine-protein kinase